MRSARADTVRGVIDRIAGRLLEAWGALRGNRRAAMKGKAARARGVTRRSKGHIKRHAR